MNAFDRWYKGLSSFNRDLILQHFCAEVPVPLGELAAQHALLRETARQCRNFLMDEFNRSVEGNSTLRAWIEQAEFDLRKPCLVSSFLDRHAWLGENIGDRLTVLRLFTGMRWLDATTSSASPTGQWIFMNDLGECGAATVRALDLDVEEVMSLSAASALLEARQVPVPSDLDTLRQWLIYCGLHHEGNQISLPQPTETAAVSDGLSELIEQLFALLLVNKNGERVITLGDILGEAKTVDGELGVVSRMLRDTTFKAGEGWVVPDRSTDSERRRAMRGEGTSAEQNATEGNSPSGATEEVKNREAESGGSIPLAGALADAGEAGLEASPGDLIAQLLEGCTEGMSTSLIEGALDGVVPQGEVAEALFTDARFAITARGAWCLQDGSADTTAPSAAAIPARGLSSREGAASASTTEAASGVGSRGGLQRERERLDNVEAALREADTPLTVEELKERTGATIGIQYLRQQIEGDARFSRSQRNQWALTEWRLPVYKPIKELISDMVDAHGGQVEADKVVALLRRDFDIKESSLRAAMSNAPFTARGGIVRRIGEDLDTGTEEAAVPAARTAETDASAEQRPRPVDEAPNVDDLMDHLGLI
ncbi:MULTISPECIES: hypothetical protein [Streptomyces]|uniref:Uncharacterized protein n=1 Tax=Streptomyces koelreuteriae TaxID=2838015 RepID=A0ABX8FSN5_9ACTN|nr:MULTISPECIES: hypothetical protein [Streptomyces]QWB24045.1 hypothetical protein KJK29_16380 [Streptomyces koelreuteriae]UUA07029.1 hypothetical protein NNW98_16460 [Streptomyces koelreuteriae]UUA14658.1 hypothetical protein NNW99_16455 [Streptomyces sp. CRCS-T-1]